MIDRNSPLNKGWLHGCALLLFIDSQHIRKAMNSPLILLADNGSGKAASVLNLRRLAKQLSDQSNKQVYPVSLQHAHKIPRSELNGMPADTLRLFLQQKLIEGERNFLLIPLFFGVSRALTSFIPRQVETLEAEFGQFKLNQGAVLYPLHEGEPRLAEIIFDQIQARARGEKIEHIILVDHGSPLSQVSQVRKRIAQDLRCLFDSNIPITETVMERRKGPEYDFNGDLLEDQISQIARSTPDIALDLAQLFISPGRHAGPGGDIEKICERATATYPHLKIRISPPVGQHDKIVHILTDRLNSALANRLESP